uniref:NADH-ubiquinone oxidoreductase chain 2 n=1 Tax=Ochthebius mediterraneus TaxID=1309234 RepID=A0A7H0DKJ7_9COLE|nr:NADH dehydrogenase subunit 2 [Ochthebius mediterraneus]QNP09857.1 NADH dehydrogenase subunit 2 [Ochthebius mediterraneus]
MMNFYKILFFNSLIIGSLITISSYSWLGMWMGLEINLLSIIPLFSNYKNMMNNEATLKYFLTQVMASTIMLFSIIILSSNILKNWENNLNLIFNSSMLTKMGAAPFHFWFPEVMEGLNWNNCLLLLTWQKIAPMILIMYNNMTMFFSMIILFSMMISGILGINQTSLRKILAYSSINHIGWMISSLMFLESIWMVYFIVYSIISLNIILMFKKFNIFYLKQIFLMLNNNSTIKMFFIFNFLSLGGLPPFLGFMPKWLTIQLLVENNMILISTIMVILTLMTLYFYTRMTFSTLMINMNEMNCYKNYKNKEWLILTFNFLSLLGLLLVTLMFNYY